MNRTALVRFGLATVVAVVCATLALTGCRKLPTGPTLTSVTLGPVVKQVSNAQADATMCCCVATTSVTNQNSVTVHVTLRFRAFDLQDRELSTVLAFSDNLAAGASVNVAAPGFIAPCTQVKTIKSDLEVKGLASPGA